MLKDRIFNDLSLAVDDIFLKIQNEYEIMNGDIEPLTHYELITKMEALCDLIFNTLEKQKI